MDDIVVRAMEILRKEPLIRRSPIYLIVEELVDTLEDERRDCRILEAIINDLRAAEEWVNGKSE
jgi:hypothetical protein